MREKKKLNRRTWAIMYVALNPRLHKRLPRIASEAKRFGLIYDGIIRNE